MPPPQVSLGEGRGEQRGGHQRDGGSGREKPVGERWQCDLPRNISWSRQSSNVPWRDVPAGGVWGCWVPTTLNLDVNGAQPLQVSRALPQVPLHWNEDPRNGSSWGDLLSNFLQRLLDLQMESLEPILPFGVGPGGQAPAWSPGGKALEWDLGGRPRSGTWGESLRVGHPERPWLTTDGQTRPWAFREVARARVRPRARWRQALRNLLYLPPRAPGPAPLLLKQRTGRMGSVR